MTLFEAAGGEEKLTAVIRDFYDAVFADVMIGFFFKQASKERLIEKEYQLIAEHFGAPGVQYSGRPIREAHARHPIQGGHFERRLQLLREAIEKHGLKDEVKDAWIAHARSLRSEVTAHPGSQCD